MSKKTKKTPVTLKRACKLQLGDVIRVLDTNYKVTRLVNVNLTGTTVAITGVATHVTPQTDWTLRKENEIILSVNRDRRIPKLNS